MADFDDFDVDMIEDTSYSKAWVIGCLRRLTKYIEGADDVTEAELEPDLCLLWDMSINHNVRSFLTHYGAPELFVICLMQEGSLRMIEICIGILGNLVHNADVAERLARDPVLCEKLGVLIFLNDIPFLTQLLRFINTAIQNHGQTWLPIFRRYATYFQHVGNLFKNALNVDFLKALFQFINHLLYSESRLCEIWHEYDTANTVVSDLCQACNTVIASIESSLSEHDRYDDIPADNFSFYYHFWSILQMMFEDIDATRLPKIVNNLTELRGLFLRFADFSNDSTKCLQAYLSACTFILTLNDSPARQNDADFDRLRLEFRQGLISDSRCRETLNYFTGLCTSPDHQHEDYRIYLENFEEFEKYLNG